jgi:hypothetical protein
MVSPFVFLMDLRFVHWSPKFFQTDFPWGFASRTDFLGLFLFFPVGFCAQERSPVRSVRAPHFSASAPIYLQRHSSFLPASRALAWPSVLTPFLPTSQGLRARFSAGKILLLAVFILCTGADPASVPAVLER